LGIVAWLIEKGYDVSAMSQRYFDTLTDIYRSFASWQMLVRKVCLYRLEGQIEDIN
jgi:hypothetical protein